ncbi:hypothetical protein BWR19_04550 [Halomonas sp. 1513]|nr:hypothetical protein BWR19_04550 [Halomonas sp. 1513]
MRFDYLLFIGKDVTEAAGMLASEGDRKKVAAWTWDRIVTFLNHSDILGLETWSYQVVSVLECLGIRGFRGFYVFQMPEVELVNNKRVFWKGEVLG